ncbi:MAG: TonB-dependent receptor [Rikenellaceae bacterium]
MKKLLLSSMFTLGVVIMSIAQNITITGKVVDEEKNPILGASVIVSGTQHGTLTGMAGEFEIRAPRTASLEFSYIGMETQKVEVAGKTYFDIVLQSGVESIDNVVVVAYGTTSREAMTGSVSAIESENIGEVPVTSVDKMLAGKMAGVTVTTISGQPGASSEIRIRGTSSINASSEPLWVVDGIPVSTGDQSYFTNTGNAISAINPNDIESITVLKDAAAASIYGSRAANGVILVTTKSGSTGKTQFTARAKYGVSALSNDNNFDIMTGSELLDYQRTAAINGGYDPDDPTSPYYRPMSLLTDDQTNWMDHFTRLGKMQEYEMNASGGNSQGKFFASVNYHKNEGVFYGIDYSKITARVNSDYNLTKSLSIGTRVNLAYTESNDVPMQSLYYSNPTFAGMTIMPWIPAYDDEGNHNLNISSNAYTNPRATAEYDVQFEAQYRNQSTMFLQWSPVKGLIFKTNNSFEGTFGDGTRYWSPEAEYGGTTGTLQLSNTRYTTLTTSNTAQYSTILGDVHSVRIMAGQEAQKQTFIYDYSYSPDVDPDMPYPNTGTAETDEVSYGESFETLLSYFGMLDYSYDSRYYLQGSVRYDGSSLFGANNRWGLFWSLGGSWNVHNEDFLNDVDWLNELKVRASYGVNGNNAIDAYQAYGLYSSTAYAGVSAMLPASPSNDNLSWEKNYTWNVGFDVRVLGWLGATVDVYDRTTKDMLLDKSVPQTSGFSSNFMNIGSLSNKGLEISLDAAVISKKDFTWDLGFNIAFNKSEILDLGDVDEMSYSEDSRLNHTVGKQFYTFYLKEYYGVNPSNGEALWVAEDGSLTNSYNDARYIYAGSPEADFTGGFNTSVRYKNFSLSAFFEFKYGNEILVVENAYFNSDGAQMSMNQSTSALNYWQNPGDTGCNPIPIAGNTSSSNAMASTRYLEDGSYLRVKDITLSYNVPSSVLKSISLGGARVYVSALNIFTLHDTNLYDPERGTTGMGYGIYPVTKTVVGGIELTF